MLGQDRFETKKSVLVLHAVVLVLVLQVWCCPTRSFITLVVLMILRDTATFQLIYIVSLFCTWKITTVEINSGVHLIKS